MQTHTRGGGGELKSYAFREAYTVIWIFKYREASWELDLQKMPTPMQVSK